MSSQYTGVRENGDMRKLPPGTRDWVFIFFMTLLMGLAISCLMTAIDTGVDNGFLARWLSAFVRTYAIIVPTVIVVTPIAKRLTNAVVQK